MAKALNPVVYVGGGKGGVGKSLMSMAVCDYLLTSGRKMFLVETDTSAPDVLKTYKNDAPSEPLNLNEREEWMQLSTLISDRADSTFVINTAAANQAPLREHGNLLTRTTKTLGRKLIALWMMDRKRESMELLSDFMETMPDAELHVVRNLYLGSEKKFELYNTSNLRKTIESRAGQSLNFPEVADRVTDVMNRERWTIAKAMEELPFGDRMELERWRDECKAMLAPVLG